MPALNTFEEFQTQALQLPLEERSRLAACLIASLDADEEAFESHPDWKEELRLRVRELEEGRARTVPHEQAMQQVRGRLEQSRRG